MRKAIVLVLVTSLLVLCLVIFSFFFFALRAHIDRVDAIIDKAIAYYLCESGLSAAVNYYYRNPNHISEGVITIPLPLSEYSYDGFSIPPRNYEVHFTAVPEAGAGAQGALFTMWVNSPRGFRNRTYYLTASVARAFPIFIRGKP